MAEPLAAPKPTSRAAGGFPSAYACLIGSVVSWTTAWGMQHVLFAWLVVGELRAEASLVGLAQTCLMLPAVVGLLVGGAVADRRDRRRLLSGLYLGAGALVAALTLVVGAGCLTMGVLCLYAAAFGSAQAFILPARDAIVSDVAGPDLMRAITAMTLAQFAAQAAGSLLGGSARWVGTESALALQSAVIFAGLLPLARMRVAPGVTAHDPEGPGTLAQIAEGVTEVMASERLRTLTFLVMGNGLFFIGPFFVAFPLMVRDVYHGDVAVLSLPMVMFPLGTIAGSSLLLARGGIRRKGKALVAALLAGSAALAAQGLAPPFPLFLALIFLWGLFGSVFFNSSRTLFQEAAPPSHRARVLSVYSLGVMGMAPVGTTLSGLVAGRIGGPATCAVAGLAMVLLVTALAARTRVLELE